MVAPDGCILDGPVHALDLTVGPGMLWLGRAVLDVVPGAGELEGMRPEALSVRDRLADSWDSRASSTGRGELNAIVGEHGMDFVGDSREQAQQELS